MPDAPSGTQQPSANAVIDPDATLVGPLTTAGSFADDRHVPALDGYELRTCLGKGGMGVVYKALQIATNREVAIKFLLEIGAQSESVRSRFAREVAVVARLEHEGIVRIIDSGVKRGSYFYVMDYVEGRALDDAFPPGRAAISDIIRIMIDVCDAVDYAHQRGVLHRDLKPGNIIVDGKGRPRLLDFGIAKEIDVAADQSGDVRARMTSDGQIVGTLAYMSPEQASGRADQASMRTDVYSLGVMLFELLAGVLPIAADGPLRDVLSAIVERDPAAPSTHRKGITLDLDAITLKALEKAPENRYATAGDFAMDLRRFLRREPVVARRLSALGRAGRWCVRNKALATTIGAASLTLIVVSATLVTRIVQERDRANANAEQASFKLRLAEDNLGQLKGMFDAVNPDAVGEVSVAQMLDIASTNLDKNPPQSLETEAATRELFGSVYRKLARFDKAESNLRRALTLRETQAPQDTKALADCLHNLAATLYWQGKYNNAFGYYRRALSLRKELYHGDNRDVATSLTHLATCHLAIGDHRDAHELFSQALEMRKRLYGNEHEEVAASLNNLAKSYAEAEDYEQAEALFRQSLALIVKLRGEQFFGTSAVLQNLAKCLLDKGDSAGAAEMFNRALVVRRGRFPSGHPTVVASLAGRARASLANGEVEQALAMAHEAVEMCERLKLTELPEAGEALSVLGKSLVVRGSPTDALPIFVRAKRALLKANPPSELDVAVSDLDIALAAHAAGAPLPAAQSSELSSMPPATEPAALPAANFQASGPDLRIETTIAHALARMQRHRSARSRLMTDARERVQQAGFDLAALPVVEFEASR